MAAIKNRAGYAARHLHDGPCKSGRRGPVVRQTKSNRKWAPQTDARGAGHRKKAMHQAVIESVTSGRPRPRGAPSTSDVSMEERHASRGPRRRLPIRQRQRVAIRGQDLVRTYWWVKKRWGLRLPAEWVAQYWRSCTPRAVPCHGPQQISWAAEHWP